jgi:hypothetical protein
MAEAEEFIYVRGGYLSCRDRAYRCRGSCDTVSAGEYYYSSGVYHPKTTIGTASLINNMEVNGCEGVSNKRIYDLKGCIAGQKNNGVVIADGKKVLRK